MLGDNLPTTRSGILGGVERVTTRLHQKPTLERGRRPDNSENKSEATKTLNGTLLILGKSRAGIRSGNLKT